MRTAARVGVTLCTAVVQLLRFGSFLLCVLSSFARTICHKTGKSTRSCSNIGEPCLGVFCYVVAVAMASCGDAASSISVILGQHHHAYCCCCAVAHNGSTSSV